MVRLRRLDGSSFVLNAALIETIEATPDTVIRLHTGKLYLVDDPVETVVDKVVEYQRRVAFRPIVEAETAR